MSRMKKFLVAMVLLTAMGCGAVGAFTKSHVDRAWVRAMRLAQVNEDEWSKWERPITTVVRTPRYIPLSQTEGIRLCGTTEPFLEGATPDTLHIVIYVRAYIRQTGENKLLEDILTHEFLHVAWLQRVMKDHDWFMAHPDSEKYVQGLLPPNCPSF
jgi:hypothetical protein